MKDYEKARAEFEQELQIRRELSDWKVKQCSKQHSPYYWAGMFTAKQLSGTRRH
jgi:hypothetical protein